MQVMVLTLDGSSEHVAHYQENKVNTDNFEFEALSILTTALNESNCTQCVLNVF